MWIYNDKVFTEPEDNYGFVYLIENLQNGKSYIGRKYFSKAGYKTVKGKRKKLRVESDWKEYFGSNKQLQEDVEKIGREFFKRTILRLCKTRGESNYWETKLIFEHDAILNPKFYNSWVSCKIQTSHVKNLLLEE